MNEKIIYILLISLVSITLASFSIYRHYHKNSDYHNIDKWHNKLTDLNSEYNKASESSKKTILNKLYKAFLESKNNTVIYNVSFIGASAILFLLSFWLYKNPKQKMFLLATIIDVFGLILAVCILDFAFSFFNIQNRLKKAIQELFPRWSDETIERASSKIKNNISLSSIIFMYICFPIGILVIGTFLYLEIKNQKKKKLYEQHTIVNDINKHFNDV